MNKLVYLFAALIFITLIGGGAFFAWNFLFDNEIELNLNVSETLEQERENVRNLENEETEATIKG